ncbi:unnamed protein product [Chondrus crispus]|uniref:Uncharacterized protein n=1 Tax=Chondrus crispus TaxID=2769 RepID=R7QQW8_CHOCR|nr:unnamed protein product [Chondrus crispus]CDF40887.1 unnamed protein product [Chondrus crispus]|eukprot:XP_005711181.1 unnamed protein product [Chondrus crispus]
MVTDLRCLESIRRKCVYTRSVRLALFSPPQNKRLGQTRD